MASIKRLLNQDNGSEEPGRYLSRDFQSVDEHSDTPFVTDTSFTSILNGLLGPTPSLDVQSTGLGGVEPGVDPIHNVEHDIESWATENFPSSSARSVPESPAEQPAEDGANSASDQICYGMIYRTSVKLVGSMLSIDAKLKTSTSVRSTPHQNLRLRKDADQIALTFPDGTDFGILNTHAGKALENILERSSVEFDAYVDKITLRETLGRATKASDATTRININIYGPKEYGSTLGRHLSREKIFLQRPDRPKAGIVYDNPHVLTFPDIHISDLDYQQAERRDGAVPSSSTENFQKAISNVYASLKRGTGLNVIEGDRRLKTALLQHQKEALDFMIQRETGPIPTEYCLWKPMEGEGEGWFCHAITKRKSRIQHPETGGGILADEMGMGKSLSILALVTKTLEEGHEWASRESADAPSTLELPKKHSPATLVIVPSALLINNWFNEIEVHLNGTVKTVKYHGQKRKDVVPQMQDADVVVTTYHTLVADFKEKASPLHGIEWFRLVLDEAHIIRRQATTFYRAVYDVNARSRWCLTGTPIQNRLEDIGALFAFTRVRPFDSIATFRRYISIPFDESKERQAIASQALTLLLDAMCLRRTKDLLHLPDRQDRVHVVEFTKEEHDQYELTKKNMNRALRERAGESFVKSRFGMFQVQLQLRILCNHGTFQHLFSWAKRSLLDEKEDALCSIGSLGEVRCSACRQCMPILGSNNIYRADKGQCAHILCSECRNDDESDNIGMGNGTAGCPLCFTSGLLATNGQALPGAANGEHHDNSYFRSQGHSSKMDALISDVLENLWSSKSIIFSSWTNTLNLVARYLERESVPYERIDGDCPLPRRQKILDDFARPRAAPVLIMTTGTGAFGLNLTSANRVFIVEPQWNPSVENQAIARAQRLGQGQSVIVTRYMIKRTVEQEMRSQQERKLRIAEIGTGTQSQEYPRPEFGQNSDGIIGGSFSP